MELGFKLSLFCHFGIFFFLVLKSFTFPSRTVPFIPSLRVDLVGLPDVLKKDLTQIKPSQELNKALEKAEDEAKKYKTAQTKKAKEMARPDEMALHNNSVNQVKRQNKLHSALSRIKALDKISNPENEKVVVKGNILSKGASLSTDAKENAETSYYDILRDHLQKNWALPVWLSRQSFSAQVQVYVDNKGRLRHFQFLKVSGNTTFDEIVLKTLQSSQPYPIPPAELTKQLLLYGMVVGFPL